MAEITVLVHTKNSAATLTACLQSIVDLADELIVMDMESTDDTRRIARKFKAKVLNHPDVGYVEPARNKALAAASKEWILIVDSDEEIPKKLAKTIKQIVVNPFDYVAFALPRKNLIFGHFAKTGWWPDYQVRLFKNKSVDWPSTLHAQPKINGPVKKLPAEEELAIVHHNYTNIDDFVDRAQRYSSIQANQKKSAPASLFEVWWPEYLRRYLVQKGYQQNQYGQTLAWLQSFFEVLTAAKQLEQKNFPRQKLPVLSEQLFAAGREAQYWEKKQIMEEKSGLAKIWWKVRLKIGL